MGLIEKANNIEYYLELIEQIGLLSNDFWSSFPI